MKRMKLLATGMLLIFALSGAGQQAGNGGAGKSAAGVPTAAEQLKVLTAKLDLTAHQQGRMRPILRRLHDASVKVEEDQSLTLAEKLEKIKPARLKARDDIRAMLNEEQKKKLDQYLQGQAPEMHGDLAQRAGH
jgi:hypothetical protein